jgi:hypothetical protein
MQFQPAMLQEGIGININGAAQPDCHRVWRLSGLVGCLGYFLFLRFQP